MTDNASVSEEDKKLISRISDMTVLAERRGMVYSPFLNSRECAVAERELKRIVCKNYCFYGFFENAERKMLCIYEEYFRPENTDFPLKCLTFTFRKENVLTHRDFLGALMALRIKRETVGDIVINEGIAQIAVSDSVKDVIMSDIRKIGSVGVSVYDDCQTKLERTENFREIKGTVASMRLDGILSLALNVSRSKAVGIIKGIGAEINYFPKYECTCHLSQGDVFSVKGYGKFRLEEVSGITKKGRIHITVLKYC
ncbi:RNA-binding protein [Porcipelethomonas sp.]|uniref:YlmH family RNA-binding protein n=1 Tax=Porcipelethomonas sp. TaxID=2981675 RepID=UPI003EF7E78A